MSSILSDFHSLKENQQPESGILVQHSQVQQSSASLQPESGVPSSAQPISTFTVQCKQHSVHRTWWTDLPTTAVQFQQLQTSKFTTTTASPAEQLRADIVTLFVPLKVIRFFEETDINIFFERTILSARCQFFRTSARSRVYDRSCDVFAV